MAREPAVNGAPWWLQMALTAIGGWAAGAATMTVLMGKRLQKLEQTVYGDKEETPGIVKRLEKIQHNIEWAGECIMAVAVHSGLHSLPIRPR